MRTTADLGRADNNSKRNIQPSETKEVPFSFQGTKDHLIYLMGLAIPTAINENWKLVIKKIDEMNRVAHRLDEEKEIQKLLEDEAKVKAIQEKIEQEDSLQEKLIHDIETEEEYDRNDEGAY